MRFNTYRFMLKFQLLTNVIEEERKTEQDSIVRLKDKGFDSIKHGLGNSRDN